MIRFGAVGTNWITDKSIKASKNIDILKLNRVYSRREDTVKKFARLIIARLNI